MAQGSKYTIEEKEKALAVLATEPDIKKAAKELGIPKNTLVGWRAEAIATQENENFVQLRQKKKEEFVSNAWRNIEKAIQLAERRLDRALDHEKELDDLIEEISAAPKEEMSGDFKAAMISKIKTLQIQTIRDISTFVGTMYDKAALANGEATGRNELTGKDGGPIQTTQYDFSGMTTEEIKTFLEMAERAKK